MMTLILFFRYLCCPNMSLSNVDIVIAPKSVEGHFFSGCLALRMYTQSRLAITCVLRP